MTDGEYLKGTLFGAIFLILVLETLYGSRWWEVILSGEPLPLEEMLLIIFVVLIGQICACMGAFCDANGGPPS